MNKLKSTRVLMEQKINSKYDVGVKLICNGIKGIVIPTFKFPWDICVEWEIGIKSSYDVEWLNENTKILE